MAKRTDDFKIKVFQNSRVSLTAGHGAVILEIAVLEEKILTLKSEVYSDLTCWARFLQVRSNQCQFNF